MRRVAALFVALWKDWLRSRESVFFSLLFPVVLLVVFGTVFGGGAADFTVHVQNNDVKAGEPTDLSASFVEGLESVDALTVERIGAGRDVSEWADGGDQSVGATRVVVVPDGFAADVRGGSQRARTEVISDTLARSGANGSALPPALSAGNASNASATAEVAFLAAADDEAAPAVRGILRSVVSTFNDRALGVEEPPVSVATDDLGARNLDGVDYYLPALIAAVVLINGAITVTAAVSGFAADGTLKRLVATPLRKRDWILAVVLQQSTLALVSTGVMVAAAHLLFGVTVVPGPLALALVLLGAVGFCALGMTLGSLVTDPDTALSLGMAVAFPAMFLSGVFWELGVMPPALQEVARFVPVYHFHDGLRQLMVRGTTDGVAVPFAVLGATAAVFIALAVRATTWRDFGA